MADDQTDRKNTCTVPSRAVEEDARQRIKSFIKTHYNETLKADIDLLDKPGGLDLLLKKYGGGQK